MGDLYTTSDLRRNADGDIEIDDAATWPSKTTFRT